MNLRPLFRRWWLLLLPLVLPLATGQAQQRTTAATQVPAYTAPDWQFAFWVENPAPGVTRQLRAVRLRVGAKGLPNCPLRLRLYEAAGPRQAPGEDILTENVFICPARWNGWYWFDVQPYQLRVPAQGFFVALEPVLGSDNFHCFPSSPAYQPTGPLLSPEQPGAACWARTTRTAWQYLPDSTSRPRYEQFVQLEVAGQ
ncbi:hypothetical protein [Hymenobacter metallilatus]|uniref:Peptide-N-glycosidase F C-terminal domain-containing protein n=1 Tax=Hymenobacter metallilatus TaxID=2493666 RepID=A0A428JCN7_9BACT|nr:hypothetical protein [Hymenobacter metallilatus]RSK29798.1 hypothetical protein EI290_15790 [Hymenobacter metallilatus]